MPTPSAPVVIVTGGAQGIGRELVQHCREAGWKVAVFDVQPLPQDFIDSPSLMYVQLDITQEDRVADAVEQVVSAFTRVDALVNAAALFTALKHKPFTEIGAEEWNRVFAVNVLGPFLLSKCVAGHMRAAGGGSIVHFASNVVTFGMADFMHYVSSKAAIVGMSRSMARELGRDRIRVNSISPGFVTTEITAAERDPEYRAALVNRQCIPDPIVPEDICAVVLFLISDASKAITGENILVNGGSHMGPA